MIFADSGAPLYMVENVYPKIDELNVEPARKVIQAAFEEHIIKAPGMGAYPRPDQRADHSDSRCCYGKREAAV